MWKPLLVLLLAFQAKGNDCPYDGNLRASKIPSITIFNQSLTAPYDRIFHSFEDGMECVWEITATNSTKHIQLTFPVLHLKNSSGSQTGDCVAVYDGSDAFLDDDELLDEICDRISTKVYNSSSYKMTVVFRQGQHGGWRWFSMNYTMVDTHDEDEEEFLGGILDVGLMFLFVGFILCVFCGFCLKLTRRMCKRTSECFSEGQSWLGGVLAGLCENQSERHCQPEVGRTRSCSMTLELEMGPVLEGSDSVSLSSLPVQVQEEESEPSPQAPPPNYSAVVPPSSAPLPDDGAMPSAPPVPSAPPATMEKPPPSYESLFKDSTA